MAPASSNPYERADEKLESDLEGHRIGFSPHLQGVCKLAVQVGVHIALRTVTLFNVRDHEIWLFKVSSFGIDVTFLLTPGSSHDMWKQRPIFSVPPPGFGP